MPISKDPAADAEQTREALRGLAHASQLITSPRETYRVLGSLSAALFSLQQSLDQLASWHERNAELAATDHGDRRAGRGDALAATGNLRDAAGSVRQAHRELRAAFNHNGRIAWQPGVDASLTRRDRGRREPGRLVPTSALPISGGQLPGSLGR